MKPPPTVLEVVNLIVPYFPNDVEQWTDVPGLARAILSRVRESVPHIAATYADHGNDGDERQDCIDYGGACAWEEPR